MKYKKYYIQKRESGSNKAKETVAVAYSLKEAADVRYKLVTDHKNTLYSFYISTRPCKDWNKEAKNENR